MPFAECLGHSANSRSPVVHEEWQRWGTSSPLLAAVAGVIHELLEMEARIWDSTETVRISAKFVHFG